MPRAPSRRARGAGHLPVDEPQWRLPGQRYDRTSVRALPLKDGFHRGRTFDSYERFKAGLDAYIAHRDTGRCREKPGGHTPEEFRNMPLAA